MAKTLTTAGISEVAAERGGPDGVAALGEAVAALRSADQNNAVARGTPTETQHLDQIDGIIVRLARRAGTGRPRLRSLPFLIPERSRYRSTRCTA